MFYTATACHFFQLELLDSIQSSLTSGDFRCDAEEQKKKGAGGGVGSVVKLLFSSLVDVHAAYLTKDTYFLDVGLPCDYLPEGLQGNVAPLVPCCIFYKGHKNLIT